MTKVGNSTQAAPAWPVVPEEKKAGTADRLEKEPDTSADSGKASKEHAAQRKEQQKLESSLLKAEVHANFIGSKANSKSSSQDSVQMASSDQTKTHTRKARSVSETEEEKILKRTGGHGRIKLVSGPKESIDPKAPMTITVHGADASPNGVKALSDRATKAGHLVGTFAYDDKYGRLWASANELSQGMAKWLKENPGRPLRIDAHSQGGRIALVALDNLSRSPHTKHLLKGRDVELNLVATKLDGYWYAEFAKMAPTELPPGGTALKTIPYVMPGKDNAPSSRFQLRIDKMKLPENIHVRVFTGGNDDSIPHNDEFNKICKQLNAVHVNFEGEDHVSVVKRSAKYLDSINYIPEDI